ncbi:MAG: hypothetical protein ABIJ12_15405 [bacterium]
MGIIAQHDQKQDLGSIDYFTPNTIYTIRAEIIPESLLVKGMIEIEFKNHYQDSLTDILFHLDRPGFLDISFAANEKSYIHFDSILYYGAPISKDAIEFDGTNMLVKLPHPLLPDQKGFFLMSFTTKVSDEDSVTEGDYFLKLSGWYPRVAVHGYRNWFKQSDTLLPPRGEEYARHYVGLKINSSYGFAYSGKLNNEKVFFGFVRPQETGEVRVDLDENYSLDINGMKYSPVFEDGYKYYFLNQPIAETFTVVIGKDQIHDRVLADNVTIDVFYTDEVKDLWSGTVASHAMEIINKYEPKLGKFRYPYLTICSTPIDDKRFLNEPFVLIPESIKDPEILYSFLSAKIFSLWFTIPIEGGVSDAPEARALYIVHEILYEDFNDYDYKIFLKLLNYLKVIGENKKVLNTSIRDKLAWLQVMSYQNENKGNWEHFSMYIRENRYLHSGFENGFQLSEFDYYNDNGYQIGFDPFGMSEYVANYDPSLADFSREKIDSGYKINCKILGGYTGIPIDVGIVTINGDTLIERFKYNGVRERNGSYSYDRPGICEKIMPCEPIAVILDPNYRLPDINRSNNYGYFRLTKFHPHAEKAIFPGYYR